MTPVAPLATAKSAARYPPEKCGLKCPNGIDLTIDCDARHLLGDLDEVLIRRAGRGKDQAVDLLNKARHQLAFQPWVLVGVSNEDGVTARVVPTFRPDPLLHLGRHEWAADIAELSAASGIAISSYKAFLAAVRVDGGQHGSNRLNPHPVLLDHAVRLP